MRILKAAFLLTTLVCSTVLFCQTNSFDPGTQAICQKVQELAVPPADLPTADELKTLADCRSQDLYFGLGVAKDPVKARKCAFSEIDRKVNDLDIAGRSILAMIYANAQGVDRNMDLAIKFSCEIHGMPGDIAGNIHELARYRDGHFSGDNYSACDHSSGRHSYEQCAALEDRFDKVKREAKIAAITKAWSAQDKKAFETFRIAADAFFTDRCANEFDTATTQVQERAFLENDLIDKLEQLERGEFPKFSPADLKAAESKLQADLEKVQARGSFSQGQITADGVNKTEKTWQAYKAAWITFGKKKYPKVTVADWNAWLTGDRVVMLEKFI